MGRFEVVRNEAAGTGLRHLVLDRPPEAYTRPGQYVQAGAVGAPPGIFALASSPGAPLELLVKAEGEAAIALAEAGPGTPVEVSHALGDGFPLERVAGRPLLLLVNGSGLSAARPVIAAELAAGLPRPVALYYGVLSPAHRAFTAELDAWRRAGIAVREVIAAPAEGWDGPVGWVQEHAAADGWVRAEVGAVLVGVPAMIEDATRRLVAAGCPPERVLLNY